MWFRKGPSLINWSEFIADSMTLGHYNIVKQGGFMVETHADCADEVRKALKIMKLR